MSTTRRLLFLTASGLGVALLALALVQRNTISCDSAPLEVPPPAGAQRVNLDPATGRMIPPPANGAGMTVPAKSSRAELVEEPGETEAGGFTVHARGHFRSALSLQTGTNGPAPAR